MRSTSQLVASILLIAISIVAFLIAMNTIIRYATRYASPAPIVRLASARLIFITDSENVSNVLHVTYRLDVAISYTGSGDRVRICIQAVNHSSATQLVIQVVVLPQCVDFNVTEGQRVYSSLLRIPRTTLDSIGCSSNYIACPKRTEWYVVLYVYNHDTGAWERLESVKPIYVVP